MTEKRIITKLTSPHKITLYKNGSNPNIYYYFTYNKKVYRGSTGSDDPKSSVDKVFEIYFEVSKGLRDKIKEKKVKFEDVVNKFLKYKFEHKISPRTLIEYKRQSRYLLERFRGREINTFTSRSEYQNYCDWRRTYYDTHEKKRVQVYKRNGENVEGRSFSKVGNSTLNRECRLLCSILRYGKSFMNVLKDVEVPSYSMFPEERREEILTKEEYEKLETYWMKKNPYYWKIISFVNNTGVRYPTELNRILVEDVNLKQSYVLIRNRKNKNKNTVINTPVPLVGTSKEIVEELLSRDVSKSPKDPLFVNDKGRQIKSITKQFKKSVRDCGIDKDLTMYSLRHLFTTRMVRRPDIPIKVLSEVLGHVSTDCVNKWYSHLKTADIVNIFQRSEDHKQEILKKQKELDDIEI